MKKPVWSIMSTVAGKTKGHAGIDTHPYPRILCLFPLALYLVHPVGYYFYCDISFYNAFWFCHVANLLNFVGLLRYSSRIVSIAATWLFLGNIAWGIDLLSGASPIPTSIAAHVGGLGVSLFGVKKLGFPKNTWLYAGLFMFLLQMVTRWLTPRALNINLAHQVWHGWERQFYSFVQYSAGLYGCVAILFFILERLALFILARRSYTDLAPTNYRESQKKL